MTHATFFNILHEIWMSHRSIAKLYTCCIISMYLSDTLIQCRVIHDARYQISIFKKLLFESNSHLSTCLQAMNISTAHARSNWMRAGRKRVYDFMNVSRVLMCKKTLSAYNYLDLYRTHFNTTPYVYLVVI